MRWIKYEIVCGKSENGEDILIGKKIGYSDENIAIAEVEAYDGYEIVEDSESFDKEPLAIEFGGTNANTIAGAKANLGIPNITYGVDEPSGGTDGDIYIQYEA